MKAIVVAVVFAAALCFVSAKKSSPRVSFYSRNPGELGKENKLICYVTGFFPPSITMKLMKNNKEIEDSYQTDLTFNHDWRFQLTKTAPFIPEKGNVYTCEVTHDGEQKVYNWEPDM